MKPPPLRDDCFAMPRGVEWAPVERALEQLKAGLSRVVDTETCSIFDALGRVLAVDVVAAFDHPPFMNAAVDGYGFNFADLPESAEISLPLAKGRSAAGQAYNGHVSAGHALRILTGAAVPSGVDTIILEEDVNLDGDKIYFHAGLKQGANTRPQGEDVSKGAIVLTAGHKLRPQDLGLLASVGIGSIEVCQILKVAVLTTGDELVDAGGQKDDGQIYDANRPMLLNLVNSWGYQAIDFGINADDPDAIQSTLDEASKDCDVILTTGGASAGDEDHISRLLRDHGNLKTWRIAIKPGRPLALALWNDTPVFGLPGNPVAAMVCSLVFGAPACAALSGQGWKPLSHQSLPAAFSKNKKAGREEYLRARLNDEGAVEVFHSEGSGRISGLSWAEGLVRLNYEAQDVQVGDLVDYIPF